MNLNFSKLIFILCLISGTMITISSNSWLGAWMGLEINLLSFIPLMTNLNNLLTNESALKYFLIQALASSMLLFSIIMNFLHSYNTLMLNINDFNQMMVNLSLYIKMGAAPFHFWFPSVMESLNWLNGLILMTWQKVAPLTLISYSINVYFMFFIILTSAFMGAIGGLNQTNLRTLMAFSSINHLSWILSSMLISDSLWITYFMFYSLLSAIIIYIFKNMNIFHINQLFSTMNFNLLMKFMLLMNFLSLGGLPPFLGFLPKLLVIQFLTMNNLFFIGFCLVMSSLITLFFYIRITYSAFLLMYSSLKWNKIYLLMNFNVILFLSSLSLFGFLSMSLMF
uniref:NADH-ubiquinone oxidoreductase chain 2 n=1 Tax=Taeniochauliodes attenuatus TaxID=2900206 RepID=A0A8K1T952_9NEOP|nr:NADH dehydrogenase subunit 2 [Taeniochauliodes attenuatus]